jgi:hypothetical protein
VPLEKPQALILAGGRVAAFAGPFVMGKLVSLPGGYSTAMIVMGSVNLFNSVALYCEFPTLQPLVFLLFGRWWWARVCVSLCVCVHARVCMLVRTCARVYARVCFYVLRWYSWHLDKRS